METLSCNHAAASFKCDLMTRWSSELLRRWENPDVAPPRNLERAKIISLINDAFMSSGTRASKRDGISRTQRSGGEDNDPPHLRTSSLLHQPQSSARVKVWPDCAWPNMRTRVRPLKLKALHVWKTVVQYEHMCMADFRNGKVVNTFIVSNGNSHRFTCRTSQLVSLFHPGGWRMGCVLAHRNGWDQLAGVKITNSSSQR